MINYPAEEELASRQSIAFALLGQYKLKESQLDSATHFFSQAHAKALESDNAQVLPRIYMGLAQIQMQHGQVDRANALLEKYQSTLDSINDASRTKTVASLQAAFEEERQQEKIEQLTSQKVLLQTIADQRAILLATAIAAILLLSGLALLLWRASQRRKKANQQLELQGKQIAASLEEKEVLLKEIHHRVKNNLQVVQSLLVLQASGLTDEKTLHVLQESQNRVLSIALIHKKLYEAENLSRIDLGSYLEQLTNELQAVYSTGDKLMPIEIDTGEIALNVDTAVPLGLIVNELVSNSFKHSAVEDREKGVRLALTNEPAGDLQLTVQDKGPGLPDGFDWQKSGTLGMRLVQLLAKQINGSLQYHFDSGACFTLRFQQIAN